MAKTPRIPKLSRAELLEANKQLKPLGFRICPTCVRQLPLTTEYWYEQRFLSGRHAGTVRMSTNCRVCHCVKASERHKKRYRKDAAYRARILANGKAWAEANVERVAKLKLNYQKRQFAKLFKRKVAA